MKSNHDKELINNENVKWVITKQAVTITSTMNGMQRVKTEPRGLRNSLRVSTSSYKMESPSLVMGYIHVLFFFDIPDFSARTQTQ